MRLSDPVTAIRGVGEKTAELMRKLGIETVEELLHAYPRKMCIRDRYYTDGKEVRVHICTMRLGEDVEVVPIFTTSEEAKKDHRHR